MALICFPSLKYHRQHKKSPHYKIAFQKSLGRRTIYR